MSQNFIEIDGEIMPNYQDSNAPRYYGTTRDTEIPHDPTSEPDFTAWHQDKARAAVRAAMPDVRKPELHDNHGITHTYALNRNRQARK